MITTQISRFLPIQSTYRYSLPTSVKFMDVILPVLIGIGLSMDCFAVSLALGTTTKNKLLDTAIIIALFFGLFQTGMILAGWAAGTGLLMYITGFDHWLAFFLLALIGIKMIIEGFEAGDEKEPVFVPPYYSGDSTIHCDQYRFPWCRNFVCFPPCRYSDTGHHHRHCSVHIFICRRDFRYPA